MLAPWSRAQPLEPYEWLYCNRCLVSSKVDPSRLLLLSIVAHWVQNHSQSSSTWIELRCTRGEHADLPSTSGTACMLPVASFGKSTTTTAASSPTPLKGDPDTRVYCCARSPATFDHKKVQVRPRPAAVGAGHNRSAGTLLL